MVVSVSDEPSPAQRRRTILHALGATPVSVTALARLTGVSAVTVRRDLTELAQADLVRRVHGGATLAPRRGAQQPYALRAGEDLDAKRILARATADLIEDGESVVLDNGTTCELIAEHLAGRDLTVMALSLRTAATLAAVPGVRTVVPGGAVETETLSMLTIGAVDALRDFRADTAVLGACAASPSDGLCTVQSEDAAVKRAVIASGSRVILPTTARKLTRSSSYRFGRLSDLDELLTTADAPGEVVAALRGTGVAVTLCD